MTIVQTLKQVLADSYALYLKTQNYHWNVTGPNFASLHILFETQYTDLAAAIDLVAERIRALGEKAPASFSHYATQTVITDGNEDASAQVMISDLAKANQLLIDSLKKARAAAAELGDVATEGLMVERITTHEKNVWMLNVSE